jgi:Domain of unknown function (DUF4190)
MIDQTGNPNVDLEQKGKDLAIASLAVSISCIFFTFGTLSFIGSILGHNALSKLNATGNTSHRGFALSGIIIGYVATVLSIITIIAVIIFATALASSFWSY